mmetsp:Transcript_42616/g.107530  ORF Transcript_42616/g.107530 Transcript_42616/m.107530 type:complete len:247 (+) Transcript_42616:71-811(+)
MDFLDAVKDVVKKSVNKSEGSGSLGSGGYGGEWKVREWGEFMSPNRFSGQVNTAEKVQSRLAHNLSYYMVNYLLVATLFLLFLIIARPMVLVVLLPSLALFLLVLMQANDARPLPGPFAALSVRSALLLLLALALVGTLILGGVSGAVCFTIVISFTSLHAIFHMRTMASKLTMAARVHGVSPLSETDEILGTVLTSVVSSANSVRTRHLSTDPHEHQAEQEATAALREQYHTTHERMAAKYGTSQ